MAELLAFIGISAVVIATPGPDTALVLRNTFWGGRRAGLATAAGVVSGQAVWAVAAALGVAALISASQPALMVLRIGGGLYLAWLGLSSLRAAWARRADETSGDLEAPRRRSFRQGLLSDLSNPKIGVFFLSLLPHFAGGDHPVVVTMLALALLFAAMTYAWLTVLVHAAARFADHLRAGRVRRILDALTGLALLGLGARLATD